MGRTGSHVMLKRTLLRAAQVITMAPNRPDAEWVDILVEGDRIAHIDKQVDAHDAEIIDLSGRVVIPGLVNAHLHTWQTALRFVGADWTLLEYLGHMHGEAAARYSADDIYIATLVGALNQINCGTTTLGDWCHNNPTPEHTDAAVEALKASGIRAIFLHGTPHRSPEVAHSLSEIDRLLDGPARRHELVGVGMAVGGPQYSTPEVALADFRAAQERGIVASMHQSGGAPTAGWQAVRDAGLFGSHTNIVHGAGLGDDWLKTLADAGVTFTTTPENELGQGHGVPITGRLLQVGTAPSLGTDTETAVSGEILTAARMALTFQRGLDHEQTRQATGIMAATPTITGKQALSWATTEGARALGLADRIGRIEPGMQADLVCIDARALNLLPAHDPIAAALHAGVANIEAVMIAGQWRKRNHALLAVDLEGAKSKLVESGERLLGHMNRLTEPSSSD
jgi:cytosine/adenosine deaminase-related metal-dependent hydrolase